MAYRSDLEAALARAERAEQECELLRQEIRRRRQPRLIPEGCYETWGWLCPECGEAVRDGFWSHLCWRAGRTIRRSEASHVLLLHSLEPEESV